MKKEAEYDIKIHFIHFGTEVTTPTPMFEIFIPYQVMATFLNIFKSFPTLNLVRQRAQYIGNTSKSCIHYPLDRDHNFQRILTWEDNDILDGTAVMHMVSFFERVCLRLQEITGHSYYTSAPSYLETERPYHQPGHLDDNRALQIPAEKLAYVLHIPLTIEGRVLRVWCNESKYYWIHTPFGRARMLRADVYHGGCYGSPGNAGLVVKFVPVGDIISDDQLGNLQSLPDPPVPPENVHETAWDHQKDAQPRNFCPSHKYAKAFRSACPYLFRHGNDPTLIFPTIKIE